MAELTRKQAKESGMLGDYAHMYDLKRLGDQVIDEIPDTSNFATTQQLEEVEAKIPVAGTGFEVGFSKSGRLNMMVLTPNTFEWDQTNVSTGDLTLYIFVTTGSSDSATIRPSYIDFDDMPVKGSYTLTYQMYVMGILVRSFSTGPRRTANSTYRTGFQIQFGDSVGTTIDASSACLIRFDFKVSRSLS